jgi:hypothetical protein
MPFVRIFFTTHSLRFENNGTRHIWDLGLVMTYDLLAPRPGDGAPYLRKQTTCDDTPLTVNPGLRSEALRASRVWLAALHSLFMVLSSHQPLAVTRLVTVALSLAAAPSTLRPREPRAGGAAKRGHPLLGWGDPLFWAD